MAECTNDYLEEKVWFFEAHKVVLENSEPFKDLEALSRDGFKTILLAEQVLREAEAKDADCLHAWQKHEALCKKQLESEDLTGQGFAKDSLQ